MKKEDLEHEYREHDVSNDLEIPLDPLDFTDFTGTGKMTREDVSKQWEHHFRKIPTNEELDLHFSAFKTDEDGKIDFQDWSNFMKGVPKVCSMKADLVCLKLFECYDNGKKGYLSTEDMRRVLREFGSEPRSDEELRSEMAVYDTSQTGSLSFEDFKVMMFPVMKVICKEALSNSS